MQYKYNNIKIENLPVVAVKINRLLGIMPTGLNDSGDTTEVNFSVELTEAQKTQLDNFMAGTDVDVIPTTTFTQYLITDIENVRTATGIDFDIYPTPTGLLLQFRKSLTTGEKNALKTAFINTMQLK